jgi:hypothetical protein
MAEEVSGGSDSGITAAYLVPMAAQLGFAAQQAAIPIPLFTGDRTMDAQTWGDITASGAADINFDFLFGGRIKKWFFGGGNYSRPGGGVTTLHRYTNSAGSVASPSYIQIENQFTEATPQYFRHRGVRLDTIMFKQNLKGAVTYQVGGIGIGDVQKTSLVPSPVAAFTNDGPFLVPNYYNGLCFLNKLQAQPLTFDLTLSNNCERQEASFLAGLAAAINFGKMSGKGNVSLIFGKDGSAPESNLTFYTWAENQTPIPIEWWIFDAPTSGAWTKYLRVRAWVNFLKKTPGAAGDKGRTTDQQFVIASSPSSSWPGEIIAPAPGPYTLPATPNLGPKIDGAGTITVPLTAGSQTAAQIATALNASGPFTAVAVADAIAGALRIYSKSTGAASSVQIDGTVANSAHTAIGFHTVSQSGYANTAVMADLLNAQGSNY